MSRTGDRVVVALAVLYVAAVAALFLSGEGIGAAYWTMPALYVVGLPAFFAASVIPDATLERYLYSWNGNLVLIATSATLNALAGLAVYYVVSRASRR